MYPSFHYRYVVSSLAELPETVKVCGWLHTEMGAVLSKETMAQYV
jgi:hypothetical protein